MRRLLTQNGSPAEWLVHDEVTPCVYLPGRHARLPLRLPTRPLTAAELSARLAAGDRRQGVVLYRPSCPQCTACEPVRIEVARFEPGKTQRRVFRRGERLFTTEIGPPDVSREKLLLYNRHKLERDLLVGDELLDATGYHLFLVDSCTDTVEVRYRCGSALVGVAVVDRAADALSAVYCYFDPVFARLSPGAYSILKLISLCRSWGLRYLYLGLYVADCAALSYKASYFPHERLVRGEWLRLQRPDTDRRLRSDGPDREAKPHAG